MNNQNLLIGVTGSAGVFALPTYLGVLANTFTHIRLIVTKSAEELINVNGLGLFVEDVYTTGSELRKYSHINLAKWADTFIILPATANIIGKIANGIADTFLSTTALTYGSKLILCPNMNKKLWSNPIVQNNVDKLQKYGYKFIGPVEEAAFTVANKKVQTQYIVPKIDQFIIELRKIVIPD